MECVCLRSKSGGIAQLAEHELCKLGVAGSNPAASTIRLAMRGSWRAILAIGLALSESLRTSEGRVAQLVRARP